MKEQESCLHFFILRSKAIVLKAVNALRDIKEYEYKGIHSRRRNKVGISDIVENYRVAASSSHPDIDTILCAWEPTYSSYQTSSVFITTFNVNGRTPTLDGIPGWLTCEDVFPPDFYIIGLQEMDLSPQAFIMHTSARQAEWKVILAKSFPKDINYDLIHEIRLVGILLAVYRRVDSKINVDLSKIDAVVIPIDRHSTILSNKGCVAISMYMNDTSVCFVNSHFVAHIEKNEKRIMDYKYMIKHMRFRRRDKTLFDHDAVFWFGDLNFRLDTAYGLSNNELRELCSDEEAFRDMIIYDQVN
ncbi:unnamed protein product [Onchocerca flexuosa]|uniref:IPPc domain-containing protein n=1 Tax=Onchocerca flexuosa TaxID=387005 RepID=A0A183H7X1_9BILA|nr:unnamed protein product [Onchocerca flexuosa]